MVYPPFPAPAGPVGLGHPSRDVELRVASPTANGIANTLVGQTYTDIEKYNFSSVINARSVGDLSAPGGLYDQQPASNAYVRGITSATTHSSESQAFINIQAMAALYPGVNPHQWEVDNDEIHRFPFAISDGVAIEVFEAGSGANRHGGTTGVSSRERGFWALRLNTPELATAPPNYSYDSFITSDTTGSNIVQSFPFSIVPANVTQVGTLDYGSTTGGYNSGVQSYDYGYTISNSPDGSFAQKFPFAIPFAATDVSPIIASSPTISFATGYDTHNRNFQSAFFAYVHSTQSAEDAYLETCPDGSETIGSTNTKVHRFPFASETDIADIGEMINNDFISTGGAPSIGSSINRKASNQD